MFTAKTFLNLKLDFRVKNKIHYVFSFVARNYSDIFHTLIILLYDFAFYYLGLANI